MGEGNWSVSLSMETTVILVFSCQIWVIWCVHWKSMSSDAEGETTSMDYKADTVLRREQFYLKITSTVPHWYFSQCLAINLSLVEICTIYTLYPGVTRELGLKVLLLYLYEKDGRASRNNERKMELREWFRNEEFWNLFRLTELTLCCYFTYRSLIFDETWVLC